MRLLSDKNLKTIGAISLMLIALAFIAPYLGLSVAGQAGIGAAQAQVSGQGMCPDTKQTEIYHKVVYLDTSLGSEAQAATTATVYLQGEKTPLTSATTNTTGYVRAGIVPCGSKLTVFYGDGTTYYYQKVDVTDTNKASVYLQGSPKRASAATATLSNSTSFGATTVGVPIGSGQTNSDVTLTVKGGAYYYGDGAFEVCALFNTANISKVIIGNAVEIPADQAISVTTGNAIKCYEVNQQLFNYNSVQLPVIIQAKPGVDPANTNVLLYLNDKGGFIKDGNLIPGYFNSDTLADVGLGVVGPYTIQVS